MVDYRNELGKHGEDQAFYFLLEKGHRSIMRNYRCKSGEIDIITIIGEYIVFTEVKTRKKNSKIDPLISITKLKQGRIRKLAQWFLVEHTEYTKYQPRFDVIGLKNVSNQLLINHIENAF